MTLQRRSMKDCILVIDKKLHFSENIIVFHIN